jgi:hypothetical protein
MVHARVSYCIKKSIAHYWLHSFDSAAQSFFPKTFAFHQAQNARIQRVGTNRRISPNLSAMRLVSKLLCTKPHGRHDSRCGKPLSAAFMT